MKFGLPFPKTVRLKAGETVVFSWIVYKSRASRKTRDAVKRGRTQILRARCEPNP